VTLDLLIIGLAIALEPIPLTTFLLLLLSRRGRWKGAAFILGWLASLAVVVAVTVLATDNNPPRPQTAPSIAALAVKMAIGVVLLVVAERQRRRLGQPRKPKKAPKWQGRIDGMSLWFAAALAPLTQPWGLIAAGAAEVTEAKLSSVESGLALAFFCVISCGSYLGLECYALLRPDNSERVLKNARGWIDDHTPQVILWVSLLLGLWLIGKSIYVLVSG